MYEINFKHPIHVFFIGIGGISMSGLAEILLKEGFRVSGSDMKKSALTTHLTEKGAAIFYGHSRENLSGNIDLVVYTSAIHPDNPEYMEMQAQGIPSLTRAQLLGQIMKNYDTPIAISGTHGKTSTTSMISQILLEGDTDPTLSIGGILKSIHGNIRVGQSQYFVTEACEYTDSFLSFFPKISIILNIEEDHMDYFKDLDHIRSSFRNFAALLPSDGTLIISGDIENVTAITSGLPCNVIIYGSRREFDYYPSNITYDEMARATFTLHSSSHPDRIFTLGAPGEHNVYNSLAAIVFADLIGIEYDVIKKALMEFTGTDRRFEHKGELGNVSIIDDYAHHPTEITATLKTARNYPHKELWCVFQPHTYTRTKAFLGEFAQSLALADHVILTEIYAARETDTLGIDATHLQNAVKDLGTDCHHFQTFEEIENFILENCSPGDLLITMGAGDVVKVGENLLSY